MQGSPKIGWFEKTIREKGITLFFVVESFDIGRGVVVGVFFCFGFVFCRFGQI